MLENNKADGLDGEVRFLGNSAGAAGKFAAPQVSPINRSESDTHTDSYVQFASADSTGSITAKPFDISSDGKDISLNFVDVPVQDFVRAVFDEIIKEPVIVDASLKGRVTVRTQTPVSRTVAMELVRQALAANGASLTRAANVYRISLRGDTKPGQRVVDSVRVIPLRYITADEAKNALNVFGQSGVDISAGPNGHFLVLAGSAFDLDNIEHALASLDVDQMQGRSFGLFLLREASAPALASELTQLFGRPGDPLAFRALPIERLNAVLVVSSHAGLIAQARKWLARLDHADRDGRKIYVYSVQNRRAQDIAKILATVLDSSAKPATPDTAVPTVAPQLNAVSSTTATRPGASSFTAATTKPPEFTGSVPSEQSDKKRAGPRITADISTNSIVVTANVDEWRVIESALRRLDIMARQVLIEATVAEVTLNDALSHGVQWYFQYGNHSASLNNSSTAPATTFGAGFTYAFGTPQAKVVLNALEQVTDVEIVSSPALTVLDNQTAKLQVGDEVPITTQSAVSVLTAGAPVVNNIEYKDTGVILSVTPRVNANGLVVLDIMQEVSEVVPTTTSSLDSPTIRQRRLNSSVAVYSGQDIILGGLISANRSKSDSGIPKLMSIPIVGDLFNSDSQHTQARTELLVILRPTVMASRADIDNIAREIKSRMAGMARGLHH